MRITSYLRGQIRNIQIVYSELSNEKAKAILKYSLFGAFFFGMAAHAFAYFNFAPIHDSLNYIDHLAGGWEVSLGRFFQPIYGRIRGEYLMPWLNGMLSMLYIGLASFLINDLFEVDQPWMAFLTAGFLSANATMTNLVLTFSYILDVFSLALLLATVGAYVIIRLPGLIGTGIGSIFFALSMGLYQSYVLLGGLLLVGHAMLKAVDEKYLIRMQGINWMRYVLSVLLTALAYWLMYQYFMWSYGVGIAPTQTYNSPARLAFLDVKNLLPLFKRAYSSFFEYFFGWGSSERNLIQIGTFALCVITGAVFSVYAIKERLPVINICLIAIGVMLFPGAAQVISVLSGNGEPHFLTVHALFIMYPLLLCFIQKTLNASGRKEKVSPMKRGFFNACIMLLSGVILFGNVRFSNEMYSFRAVQYDKTISYVTRLMERIDSVPGYVRNETEVVFTGYISAKLSNLDEPNGARWMIGMNNSAVTYPQVLREFIHMMGENMNIAIDYSQLPDYGSMEEVKRMPAFPEPGCSKMIDGRVLVKLSDY